MGDLKKIISEMALSTSVHAIPNIIRTPHRKLKIIWIIFFLISTGFCLFLVFKSITTYLEFEITTKIKYIYEPKSVFPAITICNKNPLLTDYAKNMLRDVTKRNNLTDLFDTTENKIESDPTLFSIVVGLGLLYAKSEYLNETEKKKLGYSMDDMLIDCNFEVESCTSNDFVWYYDYNYGNCYRFNSGKNQKGEPVDLKVSKQAGKFNGLKIILFLPNNDVVQTFSLSNGLHIMINNQSFLPNSDEGFDVSTGTETSVAITKTISNQLPYPYSDCYAESTDDDESKTFDSDIVKTMKSLNMKYRQKDCFDMCFQQYIIQQCDCYLPNTYSFQNQNPCTNILNMFCFYQKYKEYFEYYFHNVCHKLCPSECETIKYSVSASFSDFPSKMSYNLWANSPKLMTHNKTPRTFESLKREMIYLYIYFDELKYMSTRELPNLTFIELLSNIGGTLGLFLGKCFNYILKLN